MNTQAAFEGTRATDISELEPPTAIHGTVPEAAERFELHVIAGPDAGRAPFVVDASQPGRAFIGKGPSCNLQLTDDLVSRRHAALEIVNNVLRLTDLQSTNGTFVQGLRAFDIGLSGGEAIALGNTVLHVVRSNAPASAGAAVEAFSTRTSFGQVVGASAAMRRIYPVCERLAQTNIAAVIEGETGTGKEVLAESIHLAGPRRDQPFVVFDCTTIANNLWESALFGHERGAFTGATETRTGVFEEADGGTLFIDEIGELELAAQAKLLRVLERSEIRRVGGQKWIKVDVRVLAATRRDLDHAVQEGLFRDDLFFRLAIGRVELPPLRRRAGDIPLLTQHFWRALGGAGSPPPELVRRFSEYEWPGNVRELRNAVSRQLALGDVGRVAGAKHETSLGSSPPPGADVIEEILALDLPLPRARSKMVDWFERRYVERVLALHEGNVARAAEASGLARRYFQLLRARHAAGKSSDD